MALVLGHLGRAVRWEGRLEEAELFVLQSLALQRELKQSGGVQAKGGEAHE